MTSTAAAAPSVAATPQGGPEGPIYIDTQHDNMVHDAQLDYYGCKLATSSSGKHKLDASLEAARDSTVSSLLPWYSLFINP